MTNSEFVYNNEAEEDMASIHSIHIHMNAVAEIQRNIKVGLGEEFCEECGDEIPMARRIAVGGCTQCIHCRNRFEKLLKRNGNASM